MSESRRAFAHHEHIVVEHLSKRFGAKEVLRDISLVVPRGKTTVMVSTPTEAEELAAFLNYCNIQDLSG